MNGRMTGFARAWRCAISIFDYASGFFPDISVLIMRAVFSE